MSLDPDHQLMLRIGQQDLVAYRTLVGKHLNLGVRVAERMLGNRQDAEDVMQEACLKIWREAQRWQPNAKFSTWLYRIVVNACIDRKRKVVPLVVMEIETVVDDAPTTDEAMIVRQREAHVTRAIHRLPERQRAALILRYYEEFSNQDAADALGIRIGAFQQLLFRAKQNLKQELKNYLMEQPIWIKKTP